MENIEKHIEADKEELNGGNISAQRRRHIEQELHELEIYKENHPEDHHDPTALELFCEMQPDANECRIYEN